MAPCFWCPFAVERPAHEDICHNLPRANALITPASFTSLDQLMPPAVRPFVPPAGNCENATASIHSVVTAVIVSRDRPVELRKTLEAVLQQDGQIACDIIVVDSSANFDSIKTVTADLSGISIVRSILNLGGAGGFALGILAALAGGAEWLWLMDDDGRPCDTTVLEKLLMTAAKRDLHAVSPAILADDDQSMFAFPYAVKGGYVFRRDELAADAFLLSKAHLFNGLLIKASSVFKVGLPDLRMFARGDEIDFLHRMRRAGLRFGTTVAAAFLHPSSNAEIRAIWGGRLHVVIPTAVWRRRCQFRNRAFNFSRHGMWLIMAIDAVRYPYFFLICENGDFAGLKEWLSCTLEGLRGQVGPDRIPSPAIASLDQSDS